MAKKYKIIEPVEEVEEKVEVVEEKTFEPRFESGQPVSLKEGARAIDHEIPAWLLSCRLFVCGETENAIYLSATKSGVGVFAVEPTFVEVWKPISAQADLNKPVKKLDKIRLKSDAKYFNGDTIPSKLFETELYARELRANGDVVISIATTGPIYGVVNKEYLELAEMAALFQIETTSNLIMARREPTSSSAITAKVEKGEKFDVLEQKGSWLRTNCGWIYSKYVKKI